MLRPLLFFAVTAFSLGVGCTVSDEDACGDDQVFDDGACKPKPAATAGTSSTEAGAPPSSSEGGGPPSTDGGAASSTDGGMAPTSMGGGSSDSTFGATCEEHTDCQAPTDYCAKSPVAPPYCTAAGCDEDPEICPEGWSCFDVSQFAPGEPWICMQPL